MIAAGWPRPTGAFLLTLGLLLVGVMPLPRDSWARWVRQSARSLELNRAEREGSEAGYYEGLINVESDGSRDELALRLLGKPHHWVDFHDIGATRHLPGDLLQFDLHPNLRRAAFGHPFSTNRQGLRDHEYAIQKPEDTFRIVLLGTSIDMGWGVDSESTYENRLEYWLNEHASKRGLSHRFEVINFSMAAYSPIQRLETLRRKALAFQPDLVIYSGTMLDERLTEIHLCDVLSDHVDLDKAGYRYLKRCLQAGGLNPKMLAVGSDGQLAQKSMVKAIVQSQFWPIVEQTLALLTQDCQRQDVPLLMVLVPRAGESDTPAERAPMARHYKALAASNGLPVIDLTDAFDDEEPADVSLAPWDDHPNAEGHRLLFRALAKQIVEQPTLYRQLFNCEPKAMDDNGDDVQ